MAVAAAGCIRGESNSADDRVPDGDTAGQAPARTPPTIDGVTARGPFMGLESLGAAAWDGRRLWMADVEGRLLAVDGESGAVVFERRLDGVVADTSNLVVSPSGELWGFAKDSATNAVEVLRVNSASGTVGTKPVDGGRPLGQTLFRDGALLAADYERGVVRVDPVSGVSTRVVDPGVVPNLLQPAGDGGFWVVDDTRHVVVRLTAAGDRRATVHRDRFVTAIAGDASGNAWLAEGDAVAVLAPGGNVSRQITGFSNAASVSACGGSIVVSDVETGDLSWFDASAEGERRTVATKVSGRAVACATGGVWYLTFDGFLVRVAAP